MPEWIIELLKNPAVWLFIASLIAAILYGLGYKKQARFVNILIHGVEMAGDKNTKDGVKFFATIAGLKDELHKKVKKETKKNAR